MERVSLFWQVFSNVPNDAFVDAVNQLIGEHMKPPMLKEISKAVEEAKVRSNSYRQGGNAFANVLGDAVANNQSADPDFVKACMKLYGDRYDPRKQNRLTKEQFEEGLQMLDQVAKQLSPKRERPPAPIMGVGARGRRYNTGEGNDY